MALQAVIANEGGSTDSMSSPIVVYDDGGAFVSAADAVAKAQLVADSDFFGIGQDSIPDVTRIAPHALEIRINYRQRQLTVIKRPTPGETNSVRRYVPPMFVKPREQHRFVAPRVVYDATGADVTADNSLLKWGIDFPGSIAFAVKTPGHVFEPLPVTRGFHFYLENVSVTDSYLDTIEDMISRGVFNNAPFFGRPAGTVQFVSFSANERTPDDWDLDFGFGYKGLRTSVQVSDEITIPSVKGNEYYYEIMKQMPNEVGGVVVQIQQQIENVVLGQVWEEDDFSKLNLY